MFTKIPVSDIPLTVMQLTPAPCPEPTILGDLGELAGEAVLPIVFAYKGAKWAENLVPRIRTSWALEPCCWCWCLGWCTTTVGVQLQLSGALGVLAKFGYKTIKRFAS